MFTGHFFPLKYVVKCKLKVKGSIKKEFQIKE